MTPTHLTHTVLHAEGFNCPACVIKIHAQIWKLNGIQKLTLHFGLGLVEVDHDGTVVDDERLVRAVADAGYHSAVVTP